MSVHLRVVTSEEADMRLDRWFRRHYPTLTQGGLQRLCRRGEIRLDGKRVTGASRLASGQVLRIPPMPDIALAAPYAPPQLDARLVKEIQSMVIYRDDALIVLNKPAGLPTQGGQGITKHVDHMLDGLCEEAGERPRLVHRLDRDTSGLLLVARTPSAAKTLAEAFRSRDVRKLYWAVVVGRPQQGDGVIDQPIAKVGAGPGALMIAASRSDDDAQTALTEYETLDAVGKKFTWLALKPLTGRTHQLRVHCEALGTPILGDPKYGGKKAHVDGFVDQLHLHARMLDIAHPAGGRLRIHAPLPAHMRETFKSLGFEQGATPRAERLKGRGNQR